VVVGNASRERDRRSAAERGTFGARWTPNPPRTAEDVAGYDIGTLKSGWLARQWTPGAVAAHRAVKAALDPKGLFNPGKKVP
jgi:hypothetical protein